MVRSYTPQERQFLDYFRSINKHAIANILAEFHSTGPMGYSVSLVLARILKIKERISSDREISEKLAKIPIYRDAVGLCSKEIPAHNTFNTLRQRLGGYFSCKVLGACSHILKVCRWEEHHVI